jgi:pyridoxine 5-phosphate synthase
MPVLVVNVDHIATLRQARLAPEPDPVAAAALAEMHGAAGIIVHLREDRRHIQDRDVELLRQTVKTHFHLEMAATPEMQGIALASKPYMVCLVPEKRQELTTEGGLNLIGREKEIRDFIAPIAEAGTLLSMFIDPDLAQIDAAKEAGSPYIELHTGAYADAASPEVQKRELERLLAGIRHANDLGLAVNLGHGLNYLNIQPFAKVPGIREYSIGHSVIARASLTGMAEAVSRMAAIIAGFVE